MCVILIGRVSKELHENAKAQNQDGFSLYTKELGLVKDPSEAQVERALNHFGIWHYRIASSGRVDKNNIHPFKVCGGAYLLYHNGVLGQGTAAFSDTACLAQTLMYASLQTAQTVLSALSPGQRFALVSAKNPYEYYLYGDWKVEAGVLMSHKMYSNHVYYTKSKAEQAGWTSSSYIYDNGEWVKQ